MTKKIVLFSGFLPGGSFEYSGEHIYQVQYTREGAKALSKEEILPEYVPEEMPIAKILDEYELEGICGIRGKLELPVMINGNNPLNGRIHKYYCIENNVWIKNLGLDKYVTDWTREEKWALASEITFDEEGKKINSEDVGFVLMRVNRKKGIIF